MGLFDAGQVDRGYAGTFVTEVWWRYMGRVPGAAGAERSQNPGVMVDMGRFSAEVQACIDKGTQNYLLGLLASGEAQDRRVTEGQLSAQINNAVGEPSGIWADTQAIAAWVKAHP